MAHTIKLSAPPSQAGPVSHHRACVPCPLGYEIHDRLGAGAAAVVYRAQDTLLGRPVALKVIDPLTARDPATIARFLKEARSLAQVRHENVVQIYACGPDSGSVFLVMELVNGRTLDSIIEEHAERGEMLPLARAASILRAVARGLQAVHEKGMIHRDLKPSNIMIEDGTDRPVLIDFGLARRKTLSNPKLSITGGTPMYMAPEQSRDSDGTGVTARADLYAFACTAFEVLTGRCVFGGDDIFQILSAHIKHAPPRISTIRAELAPLDEVLIRALAKDPSDRYASCAELMAAFEAAFERIQSKTTPRASIPGTEPARVLVLAREGNCSRVLMRAASAAVGGSVQATGSLDAARAIVEGGSCDVLVVDEDSVDALSTMVDTVRASCRSTIIVLATRHFTSPEMKSKLSSMGIQHVVPKPLSADVTASVVKRALAGSSPRDAG